MGDNEEEEGNDRWAWLTTTRPMTLTAKARMSRRIGRVFLIRVMMVMMLSCCGRDGEIKFLGQRAQQ